MITEQLIDELDLPDYYKWSEDIWADEFWWDYLLDDRLNEWGEKGIRIHSYGKGNNPQITFDLYRNQCASDGMVDYDGKFYDTYRDQMMAVSPVYAQMFCEGYIGVSWKSSRNGWLEISASEEYNFDDEDKFTSGLFAGTSVRELMESETVTFEEFEECIAEIIQDLHKELLDDLTSAYEYDTSEERYKEWILEQIEDALPRPTAS